MVRADVDERSRQFEHRGVVDDALLEPLEQDQQREAE